MSHNTPDKSFWRLNETFILIIGIVMVAVFTLFLLFSWFFFPDTYATWTAVSFSHLFFGRAAGISVGFASHMSFWPVIGLNFLIETMMVLVVYPLFILSWNQLFNIKIGKVASWMQKTHEVALKYQPTIQKYGIYGLFIFVWFPFWMTGPVVGSIIGYLMGLRHMTTLASVLGGTLVATVCWAWFLDFLQAWAKNFDSRGPWLIVIGIIVLVIVSLLIRKFKGSRH